MFLSLTPIGDEVKLGQGPYRMGSLFTSIENAEEVNNSYQIIAE